MRRAEGRADRYIYLPLMLLLQISIIQAPGALIPTRAYAQFGRG